MDVDVEAGDGYGYGYGPRTPTYKIPTTRVVCVEHPCIVQSIENGLKSLGGEAQLRNVLDRHVGDSYKYRNRTTQAQKLEPVAGVSLRPNDPLAKKIASVGSRTQNVLVKVTLPRVNGRKRKRGYEDASEEAADVPAGEPIEQPDLLRRLRDNARKFSIEPVSMLHETHRFRGLPDFQLIGGEIPVMQKIRNHLMNPSYADLKRFKVDTAMGGGQDITLFPGAPNFTLADQPFLYEYRKPTGKERRLLQKRAQMEAKETGAAIDNGTDVKYDPRGCDPDVLEVPSGPSRPTFRKVNEKFVKEVLAKLAGVLEERPVTTRRYLESRIAGSFNDTNVRAAIQRMTYGFKSGPFMNCLIKYGLDPRKDPKYRLYQTLQFQDQSTEKRLHSLSGTTDEGTHIFDGVSIPSATGGRSAKTFQLCDVTDPLLSKLIQTSELPESFDPYHWGWYHNGTMCKIRAIMRDKIRTLQEGYGVGQIVYEPILTFPDVITTETIGQCYFRDSSNKKLLQLATDVRIMAKAVIGFKKFDSNLRGSRQDPFNGSMDQTDEDSGTASIAPRSPAGDALSQQDASTQGPATEGVDERREGDGEGYREDEE